MTTATKRNKTRSHHNGNGHARKYTYAKKLTTKLPASVIHQLEGIYTQSRKKAIRHPYKTAGGILLSLGVAASSVLLLTRFFRN